MMSETGDATPASRGDDANGALDSSFWRRPEMILACADYDQPRVLRWLWPAHIPVGALSFFGGDRKWSDPFTLDLIRRVTSGQDMPDGSPGLDGPVLLLHPEAEYDPGGDFSLLEAAGIAWNRILVMNSIPIEWNPETGDITGQGGFFPRDTKLLGDSVRQFGLKLLVIDHLEMYLDDEKFDWRRFRDVREALTPLARLARQFNVPVLILRCEESIFPGPGAPRVKWVGARNWTADELLAPDSPRKAKRKDLDTWLRETLAEGPVPVKELEWRADYEGWTLKQLYAAKERMGVVAGRRGFGRGGESVWSLNE